MYLRNYLSGPILLAVVAGGLVAAPAAADVTAVYDTPDGDITIEYRDDDTLRVGMPGEAFLVYNGEDRHIVSRQEGTWYVMPIQTLAAWGQTAAGETEGEAVELEDTGRTETIAGIEGRVYEQQTQDDGWGGGSGETEELVLTDDSRVVSVSRALMRVGEQFEDMEGDDRPGSESLDSVPDGAQVGDEGLLRIGEQMRLTSIEEKDIPDHHFQLPPDHQMVGTGEDGAEEGPSGGWLGEEVRGAGSEARDEASGSARDEMRKGVREGVRGLFD